LFSNILVMHLDNPMISVEQLQNQLANRITVSETKGMSNRGTLHPSSSTAVSRRDRGNSHNNNQTEQL
jgi:hypothetical protein